MGIHISLLNKDGQDHPDWDYVRHGGDRDAISAMWNLPLETEGTDVLDLMIRPTDFDAWEKELQPIWEAAQNPDRWRQLKEILQRNPDYWISTNY